MSGWSRRMEQSVGHLAEQLRAIRSGTVDAGLVASVRATVRGSSIPVNRLASVTGRADRLVVRPFDSADGPAIVRALTDARMSAYLVDPRTIAVGVPPISGEQKQETARHIKKLGEEARVAVRQIRQDARQHYASRGSRGPQKAIQDDTDAAVAEIDRLVAAKIAEIEA